MRFVSFVAAAFLALSLGSMVQAQSLPMPTSERMVLSSDANFALGSTVLEVAAQKELDAIIATLRGVNLEAVIATVYASPDDPAYNPDFALERAKGVRAYLILNGIDPQRVYIEGRPMDRFERTSMIALEAVYAPLK